MSELISMKKEKLPAIDSITKSKKFIKTPDEKNSDFTVIHYSYNKITDPAFIQRGVTIGKRPNESSYYLEYGVWQKQEAANIIDSLIKNGFKKSTVRLPDFHGKTFPANDFISKR